MKRLLVSCTALCVLFAASAFAQSETQIGVTAAVNPQATGTPPISDTRVLQVGTDMVADERVTTTASGQVQMLFLDESALTRSAVPLPPQDPSPTRRALRPQAA